jgi:hypothetical protein
MATTDKGVTREQGLYRAFINEKGKALYLGSSTTPEGAALRYAKREAHWEGAGCSKSGQGEG